MKIPPTITLNFHDFPEPGTTYVREDTLPELTRALLAVDLAKLERVLNEATHYPLNNRMGDEAEDVLLQIAQIRYNQRQEIGQ